MEIKRYTFDIWAMLRRIRDRYALQAEKRALDLQQSITKETPRWLSGDVNRIEQALCPLVSNALQRTTHGQIVIQAKTLQRHDNAIIVRFAVQDTGAGVVKKTSLRQADTFIRSDNAFSTQHQGPMAELMGSHRLIQEMGGTMSIQSSLSQGSTFTFKLPLQMPSAPPTRSQEADTQARRPEFIRPLIILLAEDVEINQKFMKMLFTRHGHQVDVVGTGVDAVRAHAAGNYDIILMDIQMPELDGIEATRQIRSTETQRYGIENRRGQLQTPILALTAYDALDIHGKDLEAGINGYLLKPIEPQVLFAKMAQLLPHLVREESETPLETSSSESAPTKEKNNLPTVMQKNSEETEAPVVDYSTVDHQYAGNRKLWQQLLLSFVEREIAEYKRILPDLNHNGDWAQLGRKAHKIKGSLSILCAEAARQRAADLESAITARQAQEFTPEVDALLQALQELVKLAKSFGDTASDEQ